MRLRKRNRVSTPKRWIMNGRRSNHKRMPKIRGKYHVP